MNHALPRPNGFVCLLKPRSDPEFVGLRQHHLQDGHECWRLAEVAAADDVGVDVEALRVAPGLYAPGHVV